MERWQKWADRRRRQLDRGKGPATVIVASEDTTQNPWYAHVIIPAGEALNAYWETIMTLLPERGGQILLLEGTYLVSSPLGVTKDNVRFAGQGAGTVLQVMREAIMSAVLDVTGAGVQIADLSIDGSKDHADCDAGVRVSASGGKLQGLTCHNLSGSGIVVNESNEIIILGNACNDNGVAGIAITNSADITVEANTCRRSSDYGIYLFRASNCSLLANKCYQSGGAGAEGQNTGIFLSESCLNVLQSNTCNDNTWSGIIVYGNSSGNTITGNTCSGNQGDGIAMGLGGCDNLITSNTCNDNMRHGIHLIVSAGNTINGNVIAGNGLTGLNLIFCRDNNIQSNRCANNADYGIAIDSGSSNNWVTNNDVIDNATGAIKDDGSQTVTTPGNRA